MQSFYFYLKGRLYLVCISAVSRPDPEKRIHMTFVGHVGELERASEQTNQAIFCCCVLIAIGFVASVWFAIVRTRPRTTARDWLRSGKRAICLVSIFNPTSSGLLFFYFKAPPFECLHECFFLKEVKKRRDRLCQTRQSLFEMEATEGGKQVFFMICFNGATTCFGLFLFSSVLDGRTDLRRCRRKTRGWK